MTERLDLKKIWPVHNIFHQSGVPLYVQLAAYLRRKIESGEWPTGAKLPSLEALAGAFDVSRVTIRQSIQMLVSENYIASKQGKGTFVEALPSLPPREYLQTSWEGLIRRVEGTSVKIISEEDSDECPVMTGDGRRAAAGYRYMKRVHSKFGSPYAVLDMYLARDLFDQDAEQLRTNPVLTSLNQMGVQVKKAFQILTIGSADSEVAMLLGLNLGDPVAYVHREAEDIHGCTFYICNLTYAGNCVYQKMDLLTSQHIDL